jgi:glycosyltransferase involved in cell wall biosynthesis
VTAIEPSGNLYGSEKALFDVISGTTSRGFEWDVVLPKNSPFEQLLTTAGIPAWPILPGNSHLIARWKKIGGYLQLARHLAKNRPSVLYVNQAGMLRAATAIGSRIGIPIVCQIQTLEDAQFVAASGPLRTAATSFICNSRFIAAAADVPLERLSTLYQPIMRGAARENVSRPGKGHWKVGILGRIARSKGHYVFLEAARILVEQGRNDIFFVVIGEGLTDKDTQDFKVAVRDSGMSTNFEFRGFRSDIGAELSRIHVVAMPSLAEPLGRVVLDACVARRPIIVSDSGGLGEFSREFEIGLRVPPGDANSLASSIACLVDNYDIEYDQFDHAAKLTEQRLNPDSYVAAIALVLDNAATGRATSIEWFGAAI